MKVGLKYGLKRLREKRAMLAHQLRVHSEEWKVAKKHFKQFGALGVVKLRKKGNTALKHSFIKIKDHLVALANKSMEGSRAILGKGAYGIVKLAEDQSGKAFALKIEAGKKRSLNNQELKVLEKIPHFYYGETDRRIPKRKYRGRETTSKLYTLLELLEGKDLEKQLATLNDTQKLVVALKSCLAIRELHQNHIIHADIKPANFIAHIHGNDITVNATDFGFSMLLKPGQKIIYEPGYKGTREYMAPEVFQGQYSVQSDIYALGNMLKNDLHLPKALYQNMLHHHPAHRSSLEDTITALHNELERMSTSHLCAAQLATVQPSPGFLANWQHFFKRVTQVVYDPLAFIYQGFSPANR